jgi:hypothetical protein
MSSFSDPDHHAVSLKVRPTMQLTTIKTNLDTDENQAIDKTDQRMRPQALLGQMMWYVVCIICYTHRCVWVKLIAAVIAPRDKRWIAKHVIQDAQLRYDTA